MSDYLTDIIEYKRNELSSQPSTVGQAQVKKLNSFVETVRKQKTLSVIAEFKRASPSKGIFKNDADPLKVAQVYKNGGADGLSILTERRYFNGDISDLRQVSETLDIPILCKDFILEESQIYQAYQAGASMILLIIRVLSPIRIRELYNYARSIGLDILVEVHDQSDLEVAWTLNPELIGINNRDLNRFQTDLATTENLIRLIRNPDILVISESGIRNVQDCERIAAAGVDAVLIGEALMVHEAPDEMIRSIKRIERRKRK